MSLFNTIGPHNCAQEIGAFVDKCFLGADPQRPLKSTDPSTPSGAVAAQVAARYVQECVLHTCVCALNEQRGAAPHGRVAPAQCEAHRLHCADPHKLQHRGTMSAGVRA